MIYWYEMTSEERDIIIADKIMGWVNRNDFKPSTDISAAWMVAEKIIERDKGNLEREGNWEMELDSYGNWYKGWSVKFETDPISGVRVWGHGNTPAEAICIAALKASGYEVCES